ncbi:Gamma-glutamylaminecyclotransferase [Rhynchospora pubera]|uniref:Gamma-glutamylcyclotransferase family protein n=1 Tax=Rhynchospora pubera TaxID=906938 RepID=A0AAV8I0K6_9POAL|nr:Gamma-glutamylaminecyclotransferase [Rhynchospora pubera]
MATDEHPTTIAIFVYGTLKTGFPNYHVLSDFITAGDISLLSPSATTATPYPLVVGPPAVPVPFLLPLPSAAGSHLVSGELVSVSPRALSALDSFEGVPHGHYERRPVVVKTAGEGAKELEAQAYFAHRSFAEEMWRRSGEKGFAEYTRDMALHYVKPQDRPHHITTLAQVIATFLHNQMP